MKEKILPKNGRGKNSSFSISLSTDGILMSIQVYNGVLRHYEAKRHYSNTITHQLHNIIKPIRCQPKYHTSKSTKLHLSSQYITFCGKKMKHTFQEYTCYERTHFE